MDGNDIPGDIGDAQTETAKRGRGRPPKKREPRRRRILEVARELFISCGYSEATLEAIAKNAGVNKRTIYELVGDKEQLFREVCRENSTIGELNFSDTIDPTSLRNSLIAFGRRLLELSLADSTQALERTVISEARRFPELIEEIVTSNYLEANREVSTYLDRLQGLGMIRLDPKQNPSELFFDLIVGQLALRKFLGHRSVDPGRAYLADRVDLFLCYFEMK
jgi:TetR/AcrR family transcriptional regulator, mexJK operon transcriptional repressor